MKKNLFSTALLVGVSTITFAQVNTNSIDLTSKYGDIAIRRYADNDLKWKTALSPVGEKLYINYNGHFSEGVFFSGYTQITGTLSSIDYSSWGSFIGFNTYDAFDYKNQKVANYGLSRVGNEVSLSGWAGLSFSTQSGVKMVLDSWGRLGIGTKNPNEKLTVKGKIHAEEVIVDLNVPADYVFQKYYTGKSDLKTDYVFPKLNEIETFVKENNHLPDIPSAKEIQENGLKVGEMNNLLLQKIEELTLYIIQQEKEINKMKQDIKLLKNE